MIGSAIFIVSAEMSRELGSSGWLLVSWLVAGVLTITAALSYGELASMMPKAGGQYVYLRESYSPAVGFLYGWTLFLVIQTGTVAAVAVGFARYMGVLWPAVSESRYLFSPAHIGSHYAFSLSTAQLVAVLVIIFLTWTNSQGLKYGKLIQNVFTVGKIGALLGLILVGLVLGANPSVIAENFKSMWSPSGVTARAHYAMARDGLFFRGAGDLNRAGVTGISLLLQGVWASFPVLPRTFDTTTGSYGNLYSNLLDYVVSAVLIFYILTIIGLFRLRWLYPSWERPYRMFGYPIVPTLYILGATAILIILFRYRPATTMPGLVIIATGIPVYFALRRTSELGS